MHRKRNKYKKNARRFKRGLKRSKKAARRITKYSTARGGIRL